MAVQPEFSHNVQTYDKSVYLRVSDAQRCRVHSTMLLPMYMTSQREHPFAVFEVCQTEKNVLFPSLVDLLQRCLEVSTSDMHPINCAWRMVFDCTPSWCSGLILEDLADFRPP